MSVPFRNAVLRIRATAGGAAVGTGFVVRGTDNVFYGLTCAHVAMATQPGAGIGTTLACDLPFADRQVLTGTVVAWRPPVDIGIARDGPVHDIAVLRLTPPPAKMAPLPLRLEPAERIAPEGADIEFDGFGFVFSDNGLPLHGVLRGVDAGGWLVADADTAGGRFIEEGASGGPLLSRGEVLAMAVFRFEREQRQALAIPALALAQAFPLLARPYPGLAAYREERAHLFFGREERVADLDERLTRAGRVAVIGASGCGKSSLALAGLRPVRRAAGWTSVVFRPGRPTVRPLANLAEALLRAGGAAPDPERAGRAAALGDDIARNPSTLGVALAGLREAGATGVLVIIDQFEEFFSPAALADPMLMVERGKLLGELARLTAPEADGCADAGVACVVTARADLLQPIADADDAKPFFAAPLWLGAMGEAELVEAITKPAQFFGVTVAPALTRDLVVQMAGEPGRLPLLQATLEALWTSIVESPSGWKLDVPASGVPRIEDGIAVRAAAVVAALPEAQRAALLRALAHLVRVVDSGTSRRPARRVARRADLANDEWAVLQALADARLVTLSRAEDADEATAELVHEALIGNWDALAGIVRDDSDWLRFRDGLDADLRRWLEAGQPDARLLPENDVAAAALYHGMAPDRFTVAQWQFVERSQASHSAARNAALGDANRRARVARHVAQAFAGIGLVGLVLVLAAWALAREAHDTRLAALRAESRVLATRATDELRTGDPVRAYLTAAQAAWWPGADPMARRPRTKEADAALQITARYLIAPRIARGEAFALAPDGSRAYVYHSVGGLSFIEAYRINATEAVHAADIPLPPLFQPHVPLFWLWSFDGKHALARGAVVQQHAPPVLIDLAGGHVIRDARIAGTWLDWRAHPPPYSVTLLDGRGGATALWLDPQLGLLKLPDEAVPPPDQRPWLPPAMAYDRSGLIVQRDHTNANVFSIEAGDAAGAATQTGGGELTTRLVETLTGVNAAAFLGTDRMVAVQGNLVRVRGRAPGSPWHDLPLARPSLSPALGDRWPQIETSADGRAVAIRTGDSSQTYLFLRDGEGLREQEVPPGVNIGLLAGGAVLGVNALGHSELRDGSDGQVFYSHDHTPDNQLATYVPEHSDGRLFFLTNPGRVEAWRRDGPGSASQLAVLAVVSAPQAPLPGPDALNTAIAIANASLPTYSDDGSMVAVRDPPGENRVLLATASPGIARYAPGDPVALAEARLPRCLSVEEAVQLELVVAGGYRDQAKPDPRPGRHACPAFLELSAQPQGFWNSWRPLVRMLLANFIGDN